MKQVQKIGHHNLTGILVSAALSNKQTSTHDICDISDKSTKICIMADFCLFWSGHEKTSSHLGSLDIDL